MVTLEEVVEILGGASEDGAAIAIGNGTYVLTGEYDRPAGKILRVILEEFGDLTMQEVIGALDSARWWVVLTTSLMDMGE